MTGQPRPGRPSPLHPLQQYTLLADGERGAILGPYGEIAWLCVPRWDSDAVFSSLIGGAGTYSVTPVEPFVWGGSYDDASMIWTSRWVTNTGTIECRDSLAFPGEPRRAVLLRRLRVVDAPGAVAVTLRPRGGYDRRALSDVHRHADVWTARCGDLYVRWSGAGAARTHDRGERLSLSLDLQPGDLHDFVLEISDEPLPDEPVIPDVAWRATEAAWQDAVPQLDGCLSQRDARASYAVLRSMTSSAGGTVAAVTTSLPERAEAGRNYDYRYVWIRDQCLAGMAAAAVGDDALLDTAVRFVTERLLDHGADLAPAYTGLGEQVPAKRHLDLPGYPGGFDIIGNKVKTQFQLDIFGEALQLFAAAAQRDRLEAEHWKATQLAAEAIAKRWHQPDAGIWELENRHWTHSRLSAVGGLRAVAGSGTRDRTAEWVSLADRILADTSARCLHSQGHWQRSADDTAVDAALLFAGVRGSVPDGDPRTNATLDVYLRELTVDGYAYRFRHDSRPLADAEGSFVLCGFLVALALHRSGRTLDGRAWYERTSAACGPPRIFSEEFDAPQRQMRGNMPQAFVHALMLEASARLAN